MKPQFQFRNQVSKDKQETLEDLNTLIDFWTNESLNFKTLMT